MAFSEFHISINGPEGTTYPSFPSNELHEHDPNKTTLRFIRKKCAISTKFFFTVNGRSPISDNVNLAYYMSLTKKGSAILRGQMRKPGHSGASNEKNEEGEGGAEKRGEKEEEDDDKGIHVLSKDGQKGDREEGQQNGKENQRGPKLQSKKGGKNEDNDDEEEEGEGDEGSAVPTLVVQVAGRDQPPLLSEPNDERLDKMRERLGQDGLELGELPSFTDRQLTSLKQKYATMPSSKKFVHPSDMSESDWARVLMNNRALHGYCFTYSSRVAMRKAKKRAFKLRQIAQLSASEPIPPKKPSKEGTKEGAKKGKKKGTKKAGEDKMMTMQKSSKKNKKEKEEPDDSEDEEGSESEDEGGSGSEDEGESGSEDEGKDSTDTHFQDNIGTIPPFYVSDDATVNVREIRNQATHTLTKQGFNAHAIEFSLNGQSDNIAGSVEAAYQQENSTASQSSESKDVQSIVVSYDFPRVVVELDQDCLELTDECRKDAMRIRSQYDVDRFYRNYGNVFVTTFALGGSLQSTREVSNLERSQLDEVKNSTRKSAGLSIQTPFGGGGVRYADSSSDTSKEGRASLEQSARLTWDVRGGDTVLCSNPPAWASTVKDFNLWRLLDQQQIVKLEGLISDIDAVVFDRLENPTAKGHIDGDVVTDKQFAQKVRKLVLDMLTNPERSQLRLQMEKFYEENGLHTKDGAASYNKYMKDNFPGEPELQLDAGTAFPDVEIDPMVGLGLYMAAKGALKVT